MDRARRLRNSRDWKAIRRKGRCVSGPYATLCVLAEGPGERFGFSTAKGFKRAVDRNRARRRLREAFRSTYVSTGASRALVVVARREAVDGSFSELRRSVAEQLRALGLSAAAVED